MYVIVWTLVHSNDEKMARILDNSRKFGILIMIIQRVMKVNLMVRFHMEQIMVVGPQGLFTHQQKEPYQYIDHQHPHAQD